MLILQKLRKMWHCWQEMNSKMDEFMSGEQAEENDNEENNETNTTDQLNDVIQANKVSIPQVGSFSYATNNQNQDFFFFFTNFFFFPGNKQ